MWGMGMQGRTVGGQEREGLPHNQTGSRSGERLSPSHLVSILANCARAKVTTIRGHIKYLGLSRAMFSFSVPYESL